MAADVDLDEPDGRRVHVSEVARGLGAIASVDLVAHGADPRIAGVAHVAVPRWGGAGRIAALTLVTARTLMLRSRRASAVYLRHDPGTVPVALLARLLRYRLVLEVNAISVDLQRDAPRGLGGHRAERVVDQVRRRLEDREAIPVLAQLHGSESTDAGASCPCSA